MNAEEKKNIWSNPDLKKCIEEKNIWCTPDHASGVDILPSRIAYFFRHKMSVKQRLQVLFATAAQDKFPEAVEKSGVTPKKNPNIERIFGMEKRFGK